MNRALRLELILRNHGGSASLSAIQRAIDNAILNYPTDRDKWLGLRHRFSAAVSELRADLESRTPMETLVWTKGRTPGEGVYAIVPAEVRDGVVVVKNA